MAESSGLWSEVLAIHSYDVDSKRRATVDAITRYFLEAAWNHAEALGFGFSHLAQQGRMWVLARLLIRFETRPHWGESVRLRTWPRPARSVFALRDFEILDAGDQPLVGGSSSWLILDTITRKPQRLDGIVAETNSFPTRMAMGQEASKLPSQPGLPTRLALTARRSDVDVNEHVNSARYLAWLLDAYPTEFHAEHELQSIEVNYVGETRAGDAVSICSTELEPCVWLHSIIRPDGTELCRAQARWTNEGVERAQ